MAGTWKTVRVFISSTFRDMQAERDHLVRFVFPRLREDLLKHRIHLIDVDLRWGVTSDQDAVGVCREVIDECRPRFMGILGGRYGWVPEGKTESITADEIHYAVLGRAKEKRGQCFFYFRDEAATRSMVEATPGDYREAGGSVNAGKLAELKEAIAEAGLPLFIYPARWSETQERLTGLEAFGDRVHADLIQSLKADPELADRFSAEADAKEPDEFAEEADQMEAFIEERTERFVLGSREPLMRDLLAFAAADGIPNVFVLTGEPGSGKSAFLAELVAAVLSPPGSARSTKYFATSAPFCGQPFLLIPHFIGASTGSTDLRRTLRRLCHELALAAGNTEPLPLDIKDLITHFQKLLAEAAGRQRVILVFDALNQFDATDGAHWMNWLPREVPRGVRIVASVIAPLEGENEYQTLAILRNRKDARVETLKPLDESDTLAIIEGYLKRYAKRLSPEQIAALQEKPASNLPLYILTALEELRTLGTYEEITERIRTLPGDARALFGWILTERLAKDPGFRDREGRPCGAALVEKFAACLGVSRHGLSPAELTALLDPGDPLGNVAALLRLLRPYLMRRGELLDFYHGQFREAAENAYLRTKPQCYAAHKQIASYFRHHADPEQDQKWKGESSRPFLELAFHLARSDAEELPRILFNFNWLQSKTDKALVQELIHDYDEALWALDSENPIHHALELLQGGIRLSAHVISEDKNQLASQLVGRMIGSKLPYLRQLLSAARSWNNSPTLFPTAPSLASPDSDLVATDFGAGSGISSVGFSESGILAVIAYRSGVMSIKEIDTDRELESVQWSTQAPTEIAVSEHGGHLLWTTRDGDLWLWQADKSEVPICLDDPNGENKGMLIRSINVADQTSALAMDRNGLFAITGTFRGTLVRWELNTCNRSWQATTFAKAVRDIAIAPCGVAALCSWDDEAWRIIDTATGSLIREFRGHSKPILCVALSGDAKLAVTGAADCYVRVWDSASGTTLRVLEGHSKEVTALALSPNGQFVASASADRTIRIVDLKTSGIQVIPRSHEGTANSIAFSRDRKTLYCAAGDNLRVWKVTL